LLCDIIGGASSELTESSAEFILLDKDIGILTLLGSSNMKEGN
jgi:hypothetical protein